MRILFTLTVVTILLMASTVTLAKDRTEPQRNESRAIEQTIFVEQAHATLTQSPYFTEIQRVNDEVDRTEQALLAQLQTAADEVEVARVVNRLEMLDVERELGVLKIQERYARSAGMLDLEMKIRARILNILEEEYSR